MNLLDTAVLEASYKLEHLGFEINTVKAPKLPIQVSGKRNKITKTAISCKNIPLSHFV